MTEKEYLLRTAVVCDDENRHCYCMERELVGMEGRTAVLLMLYPSYSGKGNFCIDDTTKSVLNHMQELQLNKVVTINLFSRIVSGAKMSYRDLRVDEENIVFIRDLLSKPEFEFADVIVAFGNSMRKNQAAIESKKRILSMLRQGKRKLFQLACNGIETKSSEAIHPLFLGVRAPQNMPWNLVPYISTEFEEKENSEEKKSEKKTKKKA